MMRKVLITLLALLPSLALARMQPTLQSVVYANPLTSPVWLPNCSSYISNSNGLLQSNTFTSSWSFTTGVTLTANNVVAQDGTTTASTLPLLAVSGTGQSLMSQPVSGIGAYTYTFSIDLQGASGGETIWVSAVNATSNAITAQKVVLSTLWQRYSVTFG